MWLGDADGGWVLWMKNTGGQMWSREASCVLTELCAGVCSRQGAVRV